VPLPLFAGEPAPHCQLFRDGAQRRRYTGIAVKNAMNELVQEYSRAGHPTAEELIGAQGLTFPRDPQDLLGNFWPEEESADEFLAAMREWRGHAKTDPAA